MNEEETMKNEEVEMMEEELIIETEGVKVNFGDFWALKGIDIKVKKR